MQRCPSFPAGAFLLDKTIFPLDTEEKYVSAEIKGACGET